MQRREWRRLGHSLKRVIEPDDGNILWDAQARCAERRHRADGGLIVARQHSSKRNARVKNVTHRSLTAVNAVIPIRDQSLVGYQAILLSRRLIGAQAYAAVAFRIIGTPGDE